MSRSSFLIITTDFESFDEGRVGHSIRMTFLVKWLMENNYPVRLLLTKNIDRPSTTGETPEIINFEQGIFETGKLEIKNLAYYIMENDIRYVITSTPPLINNTIGFNLKKILGDAVFWINDIRDHASLHPALRPKDKSKLLQLRQNEAMTSFSADLNTVVSQYALNYQKGLGYAFDCPLRTDQIIEIQNGALRTQPSKPNQIIQKKINDSRASGKLIFCYLGTGEILPEGRNKNLFPVLNAISELDFKNIAIIVVGVVQTHPEVLQNLSMKLDLSVYGPVEYNQARSIISLCDVGINVNVDKEHAPTIVGGKTYDYLFESKIVLAAFPSNAETIINLSLQYPEHLFYADVHSNNHIKQTLHEIINILSQKTNRPEIHDKEQFLREKQVKNLVCNIQDKDSDQTKGTMDEIYEKNPEYLKPWRQSIYASSWKELVQRMVNHFSNDLSVIDVGCGPGQFAECLDDLVPFKLKYTGLDFSAKAIEMGNSRGLGENFNFKCKNVFDCEYSNEVLICLEVLEHMKDDIAFLEKIKKGTSIVLSLPNFPAKTHYRFFRNIDSVIRRYQSLLEIRDSFWTVHNSQFSQKLFYLIGVKK